MSSASTPSVSSAVSTFDRLRERQYADLERDLAAVQLAYERGEQSESELELAFAPFRSENVALGPLIHGWTEAYPESYAAHQAMASWLLGQAWRARGHTQFQYVSDRGRRGLMNLLEAAESWARPALDLTARPLLTCALLGSIANTHGNELSLEDVQAGRFPEWYERGLRADPHSLMVRRTLLATLRPEWGGSESHMLAFLRSQEAFLSSADAAKLWAEYHVNVAHYALRFEQDKPKGVEAAEYSLRVDPQFRYRVATLLYSAGEKERARAILAAALNADDPTSVWLGEDTLRVLIAEFAHESELIRRVEGIVRAQADAGSVMAVKTMGLLLDCTEIPGGDAPDVWYERALDQGELEAGEFLIDFLVRQDRPRVDVMHATLRAAEAGNAACARLVCESWRAYRKHFDLDDRARYTFLLRAADGGDNFARLELASLLRSGRAELGDDGVLRPVRTKPLPQSLEYANHLVERAKNENYALWQHLPRRALQTVQPFVPKSPVAWLLVLAVILVPLYSSMPSKPSQRSSTQLARKAIEIRAALPFGKAVYAEAVAWQREGRPLSGACALLPVPARMPDLVESCGVEIDANGVVVLLKLPSGPFILTRENVDL